MFQFFVSILEAIEPFNYLLALLPLVGYLTVFSLIRVTGRALVSTGGRDVAALALAISGMLAVGPAELFFPTTAATVFGPMVWIALAAFYLLTVSLIVLTSQPKLVIYGRSPDEAYEPLLRAAAKIDSGASGDPASLQVFLPALGIRLRVDGQRGIDFCKVLAFEPTLSPKFWSALLGHMRTQVREQTAPLPRRGFGMLVATLLLSGLLIWQSFGNRELVVEGFRNWLWR